MKRTNSEITEDFNKLLEVAPYKTSIDDVLNEVGLTYQQFKTTLLSQNITTNYFKETFLGKSVCSPSKRDYVIDASITGLENLDDIFQNIFNNGSKIILTSITITELDKMQKYKDTNGVAARHILALAADEPEYFVPVLIDESLNTPDDCIIRYCAKNKYSLILLTSDKTMSLKARMYSVEVDYRKQPHSTSPKPTTISVPSKKFYNQTSKLKTLLLAKKVDNKLVISECINNMQSVSVFSDGKEFNEGSVELHVGDDVYVATNKINYISFAHYKMVSLYTENNCVLIYSKRLYNLQKLDILLEKYRDFVRSFMKKHSLFL